MMIYLIQYIILSLLILFSSISAMVSIDQVRIVTNSFLQEKQNTHTIKDIFLDKKNEIDNFYLINLEPYGFIIISAQENIIPIMAYSFENDIDLSALSPQLNQVIQDYRENIYDAVYNDIYNQSISDLWYKYLNNNISNREIRSVSPLILANWNQGGQWNNDCPGNSLVGCVAVAMGQVMHYWEHPLQGSGYSQYYDHEYGPISVNFEDHSYNFDNMLTDEATEDSQLLLYHAGVAVNMDYSESGSGAAVCWEGPSAQDALENNFNFISDITCESKINYNDEEWSSLLKEQLDNGWPVIYRGYNEGDGPGHAWNIDGYEDEYFHCNWGWGGSSNGYFYFNNLNGQGFSFVESQAALVNIFPQGIAVPVALFDYDIDEFTILFNDISSQVNENSITDWNWDFGDGNYSNEISPIHTYEDYGIYEISLVVTDDYGQDSFPHSELLSLLLGDINNDYLIDILDVVRLVDLILNNSQSYNVDADLNQDQMLTVLDIIILINIILGDI